MKVLVAAASSETQYVGSLTSCYELARRDGDEIAVEHRTIGYVARESLVEALLARPEMDAILLLDADQRHPIDMLDKLRDAMEQGNLDMVCAHYYRRGTATVQSQCYELGDGTYPYLPLLDVPTSGLHEIAVTGFGCVLIHRRVLEAVKATLPPDENPVAIGTLPEVTGNHHYVVGQDFRFFIRARRLGFRLWLLADTESKHGSIVWLDHKVAKRMMNYGKWANASYELFEERLSIHGMTPEAFRQRARVLDARKKDLLDQLVDTERGDPLEAELTIALHEMDGKIKECDAWLKWAEKYPAITRPEDLPTTENTPQQERWGNETDEQRRKDHQNRAAALIEALPLLEHAPGRNAVGRAD